MKPNPDARIPLAPALAVAILLAAGLVGAPGIALADVPNATDIATCNREARERVLGLAGPPTSKDEAGADAARKGTSKTAEHPGQTATGTQCGSEDPRDGERGREGRERTERPIVSACGEPGSRLRRPRCPRISVRPCSAYWAREGLGRATSRRGRHRQELDALTIDDLAPADQFHGGGKDATLRTGSPGHLERGMRVLDGRGVGARRARSRPSSAARSPRRPPPNPS